MNKIGGWALLFAALFFCLPVIFYFIYIVAETWVTMIKFVF